MKLFSETDYKSITDYVSLTSTDIEQTIKNFKLIFSPVRHEAVEWKLNLPPFIRPFYLEIYRDGKIPNQQEYIAKYKAYNRSQMNQICLSNEIAMGIEARLMRTYPSLVRDLHFTYYVYERLAHAKVIYNTALDLSEGIDLMIKYRNVYTAFALYTHTENAVNARFKKTFGHKSFGNVFYEELPIDMNNCAVVGDFFLYGSEPLRQIEERIAHNADAKI
ncbi:hypothetical protein RYH73_01840 [Olivibacter sp. CPCC 100613]|uniref:hypothetical protein n=1 Tax=Olivibacter sp. CPCC 100613 TaxID=3079931 RepID=UPI002FF5A2EE